MTNSDSSVGTDYGSVERGLAGDYQVGIGEVLSEAWAKTNGSKATFGIATLLYLLVFFVVAFVVGLVTAIFDRVGLDLFDVLNQLIPLAIVMPVLAGLWMMGLRRSADAPIHPTTVLSYFHLLLPLLGLTLLMYLVVGIGLALLIVPGIYLAVSYMLAMPLLIDKSLGPWEALETSRKALTHHWLSVAGLSLTLGLINAATIFTLGIGLIWTVPLTYIALGILYRKVFGIEPDSLNS